VGFGVREICAFQVGGLVVGSYVPFSYGVGFRQLNALLVGVGGRHLCAFKVGVGGTQLRAFLVGGWW
jgi:hypothetical protein